MDDLCSSARGAWEIRCYEWQTSGLRPTPRGRICGGLAPRKTEPRLKGGVRQSSEVFHPQSSLIADIDTHLVPRADRQLQFAGASTPPCLHRQDR